MDVQAWGDLLRRWNQELLQSESIREREAVLPDLDPAARASGWLGFPGASEGQLQAAEARLGRRLPPSYRSFLQVSNGWRQITHYIDRLWSTEEIAWHADRHRDLIDAWVEGDRTYGEPPPIPDEEYLVYGPAQKTTTMRTAYLYTALEISGEGWGGSGIFLLNSRVVTPEGEWEAWFWAAWIPGATRYRSFWEMMNGEHEILLESEAEEG